MIRIFTVLAIFALVFMAATLVLGLSLRAGDIRDPADEAIRTWATVHRLSGMAAGLCVLLVNSIVVTYFIGTSRWCKEVSETYSLGTPFTQRSTRLKRRAFPPALASMLMIVGIVAMGAAADPGAHIVPLQERIGQDWLTWTNIHFATAALGLLLQGYFFLLEANAIMANHQVITDVLHEVRRIRIERGLEVSAAE